MSEQASGATTDTLRAIAAPELARLDGAAPAAEGRGWHRGGTACVTVSL